MPPPVVDDDWTPRAAITGPAKMACRMTCDVPAGTVMTEVPPPRHAWADVVRCPNDDCGRAFLVSQNPYALTGEQLLLPTESQPASAVEAPTPGAHP
jgi:hypothetical protein